MHINHLANICHHALSFTACTYHFLHPVVDVDLGDVYEDDCTSTYIVNFVVIATYQWMDKVSREMMMMWVVGSLDRRQGIVQRLPRIT